MKIKLQTRRVNDDLPPILTDSFTLAIKKKAEDFYFSVAQIFEAWVSRRKSRHTQRAYREDVMSFINFIGIAWEQRSFDLLKVTIKDVQAFRDDMQERNLAPKTINRRIASLSSFYKYLA